MAPRFHQKVLELLNRPNVAALLVPEHVAIALADELYGTPSSDDKRHYLRLVSSGGYIGEFGGTPMIVARDVVVCALTKDDLAAAAPRLGVDIEELRRDIGRTVYVAKKKDSHR